MTSCVPQKLCRRLFLLSLLSTFGKSNLIENRDKSKPEQLEVHCWNIHSLAMKTRTKKRLAAWTPRHLSARSQFPRSIAWESWEFRSAYYLHGIFGWDFWDKWNSLFLPVKTGQNTMLYHLSKTTQLSSVRLGRLVRFTKSSTVGERMARVRYLQMVQLIPVNSEYLRRHSFYSGNFSPG